MAALIEREAVLATLQAACGSGRVALVAGEAGIGKTSVLRALALAHAARGQVWWGACDALETPHPLAPLQDMARDATPPVRAVLAAALASPRPALFEAVLEALRNAPRPVLMVVEDAHWADEATLDLLKFLGRRIAGTRALLVMSYRDDEVTSSHPLRRVIGELPPDALTRVPLARLSPGGVQQLALQMGRRADGVHALTRGNAFFATELLRDTAEPRGPVPATVQDVVLARFARLPARVQALLRAVAVMPGRAERWLVDKLVAPTLDEAEAALASGLLLAEGDHLAYRHELGRVAVEAALPTPAAQDLHRRVLAALEEPGRETAPARCVHHAVLAHDRDAISRHAPQAAQQASQRGSAREAAALWRTALEHGQPRDEAEHMAWLDSFELAGAPLGLNEPRLVALRQLQALALRRGDIATAARARARQTGPLVGQLRHADAQAAIDEALALLAPLQPPGAAHAFVWGLASFLSMLERDCAHSIELGQRAIALATALGETTTLSNAEYYTGAALLFVDIDVGRKMLLNLRDRYRASGNLLRVANVLSMLGSGLGELMHLAEAEACLSESLVLAEAHDIRPVYTRAWLALCRMYTGRWDEAAGLASAVVSSEHDSSTSRLMALLALARLRVRRGDPGADDALDEALAMAAPSGTLQRLGPTHASRAEAAFARGDMAAVLAEVAAALPLAQAKSHPWFIGELAYWGWRAGGGHAGAALPLGCAEPYALQISGQWQAAADAWQALNCPYERARALAEGDADAQREALALFDGLGARPAAEALRRRLRDAGVRGVQRGARASTRAHPCGLTSAEMTVLTLMAQDLRNADIAARLHRSVRTVDHHVAAVLAKLAVDSRLDAVRRAEREGWLAAATAPSGPSAQSGQARDAR